MPGIDFLVCCVTTHSALRHSTAVHHASSPTPISCHSHLFCTLEMPSWALLGRWLLSFSALGSPGRCIADAGPAGADA